jgi:cystinosin
MHSVDGLSLDFLLANALGFFCYGIFNVLLYTQDNLRAEFVKGYSKDILVSITDVAFSAHALSVTIATLAQYFWLKVGSPTPTPTPTSLFTI